MAQFVEHKNLPWILIILHVFPMENPVIMANRRILVPCLVKFSSSLIRRTSLVSSHRLIRITTSTGGEEVFFGPIVIRLSVEGT